MATNNSADVLVGVTAFKARSLAYIDDVAAGKTGRVILMKHNRPVAAIVPVDQPSAELWGALRGTVTVPPGVDLTLGTGDIWDADQ